MRINNIQDENHDDDSDRNNKVEELKFIKL